MELTRLWCHVTEEKFKMKIKGESEKVENCSIHFILRKYNGDDFFFIYLTNYSPVNGLENYLNGPR